MLQPRSLARCLAAALLASSIAAATATSVTAGTPAASGAALAAVAPSGRITVDVVSVNGSGCPAGTAHVDVAPDNTAFTVNYTDYMASAGAGTSVTDFRKNCLLALRVNVPSGFTYAIAQADYRGYAFLASGATAVQQADYYFQGQSATATSTHKFAGYMDDNWLTTDVTPVATQVFRPCGRDLNLNINTSLRINAGTSDPSSTSIMTMDATDGGVSTIYHFAWRKCG